jgi:hypothetical protein
MGAATTYGWQTSWSARTLYVYAHADLAQNVRLQEIFVSRLCSQEENSFFLPWQSERYELYIHVKC